jgi:hypothetical protein
MLIAAAAISGFAAVFLFVKEPTFYYAVGLGLALGCVTYLATHPQLRRNSVRRTGHRRWP